MKRMFFGLLATCLLMAIPAVASAQGGGASSTGTIQGRVADSQGAGVPGATVTASSPSMLGLQTTVTSESGNYRFPAVPPGIYTLTFELTGFANVRREGIQISLGFTATINAEMALASLEESITVKGNSPLIDTTATRVQENYKLEQLQAIPNGRDMWSLLAITPGVTMGRIDVAGNRVGTQTPYRAYGLSGQVRVLIEGINTTEAQDAAGFYFDYGAFEESFIGTIGQTAEMPAPGIQSSFLALSGTNKFAGEYYLDWYNAALQGSNIPDRSNEVVGYYDTSMNVGGPSKVDKIWWHTSYRDQKNQVKLTNYLWGGTTDVRLWNPSAKLTYQMNPKHKLIGYYQYGGKYQPHRPPSSAFFENPGATWNHESGTWVYKGEWNGTLSNRLYVEARYGNFGSFIWFLPNSDENYYFRDSGLNTVTGANRRWERPLDRKQINGAVSYFLDTGTGSHTLKFGGERFLDSQYSGYIQGVGGNIEHVYTNGRPNSVIFYFPTATKIQRFGNHDNMLSQDKMNATGLFVTDSWAIGRVTLNLGLRWDRYLSFMPEQRQLAGTTGPVSISAVTFPKKTFATWNRQFAPRLGLVWDLTGENKTVLKASYGLYWHNPAYALSAAANPNQSLKTITYAWNDANRDRQWQAGEEGAVLASALAGAISVDPNVKDAYSHEIGIFLERELPATARARVGFVYKTADDLWSTYRPGRGLSAYTVPFPFVDIGPDGVAGGIDDRTLTLLGLPSTQQANFPVSQVILNTGQYARYKTLEASVSKRYGNRWSAVIGGSYTFSRHFPAGFPNDPNAPGVEDQSNWDLKVSGSYDGPWGLQLSPVLRHQAGPNFARQIVVPSSAAAAFGLVYAGTIYAEPANARRQDNISVVDLRTQKTVSLTARYRLRLFIDLFNVTNSSASETITQTTGLSFLKPATILAPRTVRVGFRFSW